MYATASAAKRPVTVPGLLAAKQAGQRLAMLTCYDAGFARAVDAAGVDLVLVGDSLGMVLQGGASVQAPIAQLRAYMKRLGLEGPLVESIGHAFINGRYLEINEVCSSFISLLSSP